MRTILWLFTFDLYGRIRSLCVFKRLLLLVIHNHVFWGANPCYTLLHFFSGREPVNDMLRWILGFNSVEFEFNQC